MRADRISGAVIVLFAAAVIWANRVLPFGSVAEPGAGFVPLALALILGGLGIAILIGGGRGRHGPPTPPRVDRREVWRAGAILGACAFAALMLERLGYRLTIAALLLFLFAAVERRRPLAAAAIAVTLAAGSHYLFADVLRVPLPRGPFGI